MARFTCTMPDLSSYTALETVLATGDKDAKARICMAGARVLIHRLREFLEANTSDPNTAVRGRLADSLTAEPINGCVFVGPKGKHHGKSSRRAKGSGYHRPKTGQGKSGKRQGHHGMTAGTSAADVGFMLEFGTERMDGIHWMETTVDAAGDEVVQAMAEEWNKILDELGL